MTVLNRAALPNRGPYIDFVLRDEPIFFPWGPRRTASYAKDVFFEFSDDLLGAICWLTGLYSPFDPYGETHYMSSRRRIRVAAKQAGVELQGLAGKDMFKVPYGMLSDLERPLAEWRLCIGEVDNSVLRDQIDYLFDDDDLPASETFRHDLIETLDFLLAHVHRARQEGKLIVVLGI